MLLLLIVMDKSLDPSPKILLLIHDILNMSFGNRHEYNGSLHHDITSTCMIAKMALLKGGRYLFP